MRVALAAALMSVSGCASPFEFPIWAPLPRPAPSAVDAVVFLIGDAGDALPGESPVLLKLSQEVEEWSEALQREGAVSTVYLGDIVYPVGVRNPGSEEFPRDSTRVEAQVAVVSGEQAMRHRSSAYFLAGNHDWADDSGEEGMRRVRNLANLIDALRADDGPEIHFVPEPGLPGPAVIDVGERARVVALDTHWWLQADPDDETRDRSFAAIHDAFESSGDRSIVMAAHHPFVSGGSHGGPVPFQKGLGMFWLLRQTGTLLQDLNSPPYRELLMGLSDVFQKTSVPLVWAGGHDHSLQVIEGVEPLYPEWSLVSGSGSKLSRTSDVDGMAFAQSRPGFMRLTYWKDGTVDLQVVSAPERFLNCDQVLDRCVAEGADAFTVVYERRLRDGRYLGL